MCEHEIQKGITESLFVDRTGGEIRIFTPYVKCGERVDITYPWYRIGKEILNGGSNG